LEFTIVSDGGFRLDGGAMFGVVPKPLWEKKIPGDERNRIQLGMNCVLVDDMVDTAGTLCKAAEALKDEGAVKVVAYITHPVLSGAAIERISNSVLDELVVTDTIPLSRDGTACKRIRQLSVAGLLAETIRRISDEESVSSLYID